MQLKSSLFCMLILSVFYTDCPQAAVETIGINAGDIRTSNDMSNNTLLKIIPVSISGTSVSRHAATEVMTSYSLLDAPRGIYQSDIPGIGFSICQGEGENCLISDGQKIIPEGRYYMRFYKTGELKGGEYTSGALMTLHSVDYSRQINLTRLVVHNMSCAVTKKNVNVTFPDATISYKKEILAEKNFLLPVTCYRERDYNNVTVEFSFTGQRYDNYTLETNLPGLGIRLIDTDGRAIALNQNQPKSYRNMNFSAKLVRLPAKNIQSGDISVSVSATVTMR